MSGQKLRYTAAVLLSTLSLSVFASGGPSGASVADYAQGGLGGIVVNPYKIAPLTAIIKNGGYELSDVTVTVKPKKGGQTISYKVSDGEVRTHGGIPVFGLYGDYRNTVVVSYTKKVGSKVTKVKDETYNIYTSPVVGWDNGSKGQRTALFDTKVNKVEKKYADRLYFVNNFGGKSTEMGQFVWNNPGVGAMEWGSLPSNAIIDTKGEIRWYLRPDAIYDPSSVWKSGSMMGFEQGSDGKLTWGFGQRYVKYDIMGREIWNRVLPRNYIDFTHAMDAAQNGHYFLKVGSADTRRTDGKRVRTIRDVIVEVDENGSVVDEWRLFDILDPWRSDVLKAMDQGAVCLNVDLKKAGHTLSQDELDKMDNSDEFGDITGTGSGRNWAHVNSVDYDPSDDSIILSVRNQSAVVKIGRDKKVKWILAAPQGWNKKLASKLLVPVDSRGKKLTCDEVSCSGTDFDWTWTQHSAWRVDAKSDKNVIYVSVFDNGDGRGMEQPALPSMKYSRGVIYKIDQKKMTVEQVWEYGKEQGSAFYSPITSMTQYQDDKKSVLVYSASIGLLEKPALSNGKAAPRKITPRLLEFDYGSKKPSVDIELSNLTGYQAFPFDVNKAFK